MEPNCDIILEGRASSPVDDFGGRDQLSAIECGLIEGFAGAQLLVHNLNCRLAQGETINFSEHAQACSEMVRIAAQLATRARRVKQDTAA